MGTCTRALSQERTGPGLVPRVPKKATVRGKGSRVGLLLYQEVGAGPCSEVTSEQRQKEAQGWPGREGILAKGEPARAHSDTVLPSSVSTSAGFSPSSTHSAEGSAREGTGARPSPSNSPPCLWCRTGLPPGSSDLGAGSQHLHSQSPQTLGPGLAAQLRYKFSRYK